MNGNQEISRISATTGFLFGGRFLRLYIGGGYGNADILWGLDIHNYSSGMIEREVWARNVDRSAAGPEVEAGVFLKLGVLNIMAGGSMIKDSKLSRPYHEFHVGIGFSSK